MFQLCHRRQSKFLQCISLVLLLSELSFQFGAAQNPQIDKNQPTPVGGPNVCRSRTRNYCCPGWSLKRATGLCIIPLCSRQCGNGTCVKPNICMCQNGNIGISCSADFNSLHAGNETKVGFLDSHTKNGKNSCPYPCLNGGTCAGTKCVCKPGYSGEICSEPICKEPCLNNGRCIGPDRCACVYGYAGKTCEADYRTGPCFTQIENTMCQGQLEGVICTKQLCCATIGKAWGHPCEACPQHLDCEEGFLKNIHSGQCVEIDECEAVPGLCKGGTCVNTVGSFKCECPSGKTRNPETNSCDDLNECEEYENICQDGTCVNTDDSYYCQCNPGFISTPDRKHCLDSKQGNCYTSVKNGVYENKMKIKLSRKDCCCGGSSDRAWGDDFDPCPNPGESDHTKLCLGGTKGIVSSSITVVNECVLQPTICGGGRCIDTSDGYECECYPGYQKSKSSSGLSQVCEDVDECKQNFCVGGHCENLPGSFTCSCPPGFDVSSDGKTCIDHDECRETGMCANGLCINMDGSFKCQCKNGYVLSTSGHACSDVDECYENPRICLNGHCYNTPGSYRCHCQPGFTTALDGAFCVDINECTAGNNICHNGKCVNTDGSFKCVCDSGYRLDYDRKICIDIDECVNNPCQAGKCINTPGSFQCECRAGFHLGPDGRSCQDTMKDLCYAKYQGGQCTNAFPSATTKSSCCCSLGTPGQISAWGTLCMPCPNPNSPEFQMLCPHGSGMTYNGDDINECAQNPTICQNGACENLMGTYRCICNAGYEIDDTGRSCRDIDECAHELVCTGGQCRNTPGSFQCVCPSGTRLNSVTQVCEDIDECEELGPEACINGECVNTVGSYECECLPGTVVDNTGHICIDNQRGTCWARVTNGRCENNLPRLTLKSECCCSIGVAWGSPCETCDTSTCDCPKGFAKVDGKSCTDVNECELSAGVCRGGGTCLNTEGSFTCVCPPGLTLDPTGTLCLDKRIETCFVEFKQGVGHNAIDGLFSRSLCCCSSVGRAWGGTAREFSAQCEACPRPGTAAHLDLCPKGPGFLDRKDINECVEFPGICANGRCKNTVGGFTCRCNQGFTLDENGIKCLDIDECNIMHGVCGDGKCINTPGNFECECKEGYESSTLVQVCTDINECERTPGLCRGGTCRNTPGSFYCQCPPGHELSPDKLSCKDIDECSRSSGICSNGVCENMMGTYQCICNDGFQQADMKSHCEDVNECETNNGGCDDICHNTAGSFVCSCRTGYALQPNGHSCIDINECSENRRICSGGECINTQGSFTCVCTNGLKPGINSSQCIDINECEDKERNVCNNGECLNTIGSYKCQCETGYSVKPIGSPTCTDEDECKLGIHNCDINADCVNNPGSYSCRCHDGFTGNGYLCQDVNECLSNNGGCDQNAQCINTDGSFQCVCDQGFQGNGTSCSDLDECTENASLCENGHCLNYPGSFNCECEMGFMHPDDKNEHMCVDINECEMFNNLCVYGRCINVFGMFRCECDEGFQLDSSGGNCTDINECESPQACLYGTCTNTIGSFKCSCPPNYQLVSSGNACVDKRESRCYLNYEGHDGQNICSQELGSPVTKSTCCCSIGRAWGSKCELCPAPGSEEHSKLCPGGSGYKPNVHSVILEDINECEEHHNLCENGHCTNTFGSYMCSCKDGFKLDEGNTVCTDIDECSTIPDICGAGDCFNEEGSYHCACPDGFVLLPNGKECVDMRKDQCYLNYSDEQCSLPMSNPQTRMLCCCSMGLAWGKPCLPCPAANSREYLLLCGARPGQIVNPMTNITEEIDECSLMPQMCNNGICINTPGSFYCQCNRGFVYDDDSHQCIDENECLHSPSPCKGNSQCVNSPGSYECTCSEGYTLGVTLRECTDIDECNEKPGICRNGDCKNFEGSFQCICHNGFTLTENRESCEDIDECQRHINICNNGTCYNTVGSFMCHCYPGFKLSHNNDCIDVDECRMMPYLCRNGRCRNTVGSFNCDCADGYALSPDRQNCRDIDECLEVNGTCPNPGRCQNLMGSFICTCPPGYRLAADKKSCLDIDECIENEKICEGGTCTNTAGGVICDCPPGFVLSHNGMKCIDMRQDYCYDQYLFKGECSAVRAHPLTMKECCCSMGAAWGQYCQRCPRQETVDFQKLCPEGAGRGDWGEDLNECTLMPNVCEGGDCVNTDGSFRCECPTGYVLDSTGKKCVDENECSSNINLCGNGTCANLIGGFECSCSDGYTSGPLQVCEDVNECIEMSNHCAFRCHNVPGSYRCICPYGYTLAPDGRHCQDVDECVTPANNCKYQCKNLIGSFICICPEGFAPASTPNDCVDVDECANDPNLCKHGTCVNLLGNYRCDCFDGYKSSVDNKHCLDDRKSYCYEHVTNGKCLLHNHTGLEVTRAQCCCTMGVAWGSQCLPCPARNSEEFHSLCPQQSGYAFDGLDINECQTMPELCRNGRCINTLGSYRCICNKGFRPDHGGTHCRDVNECDSRPSPCDMGCENTIGSYICSCPPGLTLSHDNRTCVDIDECATGEHICYQKCTNTHGSYQCSCLPGYKQVGDHCIDIDECANHSAICPPPGNCINTLGSYRCLCPLGYKLDSSGTYCTDIDECSDDNKCQNSCQNLMGKYKCGCAEGFIQHAYLNQCLDENECAQNPCGNQTRCINTVGSYRCDCPPGFQFDEGSLLCLQLSKNCLDSPCEFGCNAIGSSGFSCGCPSGYYRIGEGHCLLTISPFGSNIPMYPIKPEDDTNDRKIISTEGCFSCKINGRHRRMTNGTQSSNHNRHKKKNRDKLKLKRNKENSRNTTSHSENDQIHVMNRRKRQEVAVETFETLHINLAQTKHRTHVIKLRPAIKNDFHYEIVDGNEEGILKLHKKHGVWTLHFKHRLKEPATFLITIKGEPNRPLKVSWEKPLILKIKIIVVP
nr:PREDICTED: fibrillin-2-like [Bemisia tabaci]XP_018912348.1 PREDICTED: fibrillin-2-like [Bemisia tabaci]